MTPLVVSGQTPGESWIRLLAGNVSTGKRQGIQDAIRTPDRVGLTSTTYPVPLATRLPDVPFGYPMVSVSQWPPKSETRNRFDLLDVSTYFASLLQQWSAVSSTTPLGPRKTKVRTYILAK